MPKIYSVYSGGAEEVFFTQSLAEAKKRARELAKDSPIDVEVELQEIDQPSMALVLHLLNRRGWAHNRRTVWTAKSTRREEEE